MNVVVETEHFIAASDPARQVLRLERTESRFPITAMDDVFAPLRAVVDPMHLEGWGILLDLRRAPPRIDDAFEGAMNAHMGPLLTRFRRRAILVKSAVGVLQVNRVSKRMGATDDDTAVFKDDADGLAFLLRR